MTAALSPGKYVPVSDVTLPLAVSSLTTVTLIHFAVYVALSEGIAKSYVSESVSFSPPSYQPTNV